MSCIIYKQIHIIKLIKSNMFNENKFLFYYHNGNKTTKKKAAN